MMMQEKTLCKLCRDEADELEDFCTECMCKVPGFLLEALTVEAHYVLGAFGDVLDFTSASIQGDWVTLFLSRDWRSVESGKSMQIKLTDIDWLTVKENFK